MEGEQPHLGDLLTMVINHLLTGMIIQVVGVWCVFLGFAYEFLGLASIEMLQPDQANWLKGTMLLLGYCIIGGLFWAENFCSSFLVFGICRGDFSWNPFLGVGEQTWCNNANVAGHFEGISPKKSAWSLGWFHIMTPWSDNFCWMDLTNWKDTLTMFYRCLLFLNFCLLGDLCTDSTMVFSQSNHHLGEYFFYFFPASSKSKYFKQIIKIKHCLYCTHWAIEDFCGRCLQHQQYSHREAKPTTVEGPQPKSN